ncbi:MAG: phospholipase D-like domain-containing protein [bacterium]|nr:phospholipase D-like domain-containing protein [bacterium]
MPGFDIESLLRFAPPEYLCERCCALLPALPQTMPQGISAPIVRCPSCGVQYIPTDDYPFPGEYLAARGRRVNFQELYAHTRELARIGRDMRLAMQGQAPGYPPMRGLLEALNSAQQFVHFTTYGISALLLGALKLAAQRVDVRGVVSGVKNEGVYKELTEYREEAPRLDTRVFQQEGQYFPHQKIIVIDGLIAFKGSANLTDFGWRKAAQGREVIEIVTDTADVIDLHNRFFSPVWASLENDGDQTAIVMTAYSNGAPARRS